MIMDDRDLDLKTLVEIDGKTYLLSTVALPYVNGYPITYETMLFPCKEGEVDWMDLYCMRYATRNEAVKNHNRLLFRMNKGERIWEVGK